MLLKSEVKGNIYLIRTLEFELAEHTFRLPGGDLSSDVFKDSLVSTSLPKIKSKLAI